MARVRPPRSPSCRNISKTRATTILLAACDTFRAAAADQLSIWADRAGCEIVKGAPGADPASVAHDACQRALARRIDIVIVDTAGRLHTQTHLMRELEKIRNVIQRLIPGAPHEVLACDRRHQWSKCDPPGRGLHQKHRLHGCDPDQARRHGERRRCRCRTSDDESCPSNSSALAKPWTTFNHLTPIPLSHHCFCESVSFASKFPADWPASHRSRNRCRVLYSTAIMLDRWSQTDPSPPFWLAILAACWPPRQKTPHYPDSRGAS